MLPFFVNAGRSGEKLKKGTFLEKKGGYFKLSGENILTSILTAFHPFLTLPNKTLKREKGTFFQFEAISSKARKRYLFLRFRNVPIKRAKEVPFLRLEAMFSKKNKVFFFF